MTQGSYKQFCPVAMAAEILCTRGRSFCCASWSPARPASTICAGACRGCLRRCCRSASRISRRPASSRGSASRTEPGATEYHLTPAGRDLRPVIEAIGNWGQHWVEAQLSLQNLDPSLLMWDMRRNLDPTPMPRRRCVIHFIYPDQPSARRQWWLVVEPDGDVDLCSVDPGFDVDLYVGVDLRTMTAIWMGLTTVSNSTASGKLTLTGDRSLARDMQTWLGLSPFASEKKLVPA